MLKKIFLLLMTLISVGAMADSHSFDILESLSRRFNGYSAYRIDFRVSVEGQQGSVGGHIIVSGCKFVMRAAAMENYYDGTTLWSYDRQANRVDVKSLKSSDPNVMMNLSKLMAVDMTYFNHRMVDDGTKWSVVELTPKAQIDEYSSILIYVDPLSKEPCKIKVMGQEQLIISIGRVQPNVVVAKDTFRFDASKYKDVEIVDFR
ncbi:MAG: outer membrane lipoprotein carrier protein LolA [Mucinivorans sp.]